MKLGELLEIAREAVEDHWELELIIEFDADGHGNSVNDVCKAYVEAEEGILYISSHSSHSRTDLL